MHFTPFARAIAASAVLLAAGGARADTMTYAIDAGFETCSVFDSGPLTFVYSTSCGRVTGTITVDRSASAVVTEVNLESWLPGDWGRAARYTYNIAGEQQDAVDVNHHRIEIITTDIFTPPSNYLEAGMDSWTNEETTTLRLRYTEGLYAGESEFVFSAEEIYGVAHFGYNPYLLQADVDGEVNFAGLLGHGGYGFTYNGNPRGEQTNPLISAYEYTPGSGGMSPVADVPLPAALPLMALGLGALGMAGRRRRG